MPLPNFVPFGKIRNYFNAEKELIKHFGPRAEEVYFEMYSDSVNFNAGLTGIGAFDTFSQSRMQKVTDFGKLKLPNGSTLDEKLNAATPEVTAVKTQLEDALKADQNLSNAIKAFNSRAKALNAIVTDNLPQNLAKNNAQSDSFNPEAVGSELHKLQSEGTKAIKAQHQLELNRLDALFKDNAFVNNLKTSLGVTDVDLPTVQKDMTDALKKRQGEDLDKFEKAVKGDIDKLYKASQDEYFRISFLADLYRNKQNKAAIDALAEKNRKTQENTAIHVGIDANKGLATFKNVRVEDLKGFLSYTGRQINIEEQKGKDNKSETVLTMTLPKWGLNYYYGSEDKVLGDMTTIAAAVRACGHDSIIMDVNYKSYQTNSKGEPDNKHVMDLARKAYEGALKAGFPPDKITINVNGEAKKAEDLFAEYPNRLKLMQDKAETDNQRREEYVKRASSPEATRDFKDRINKISEAQERQEAQQQQQQQQLPPIAAP
ncbi:hypothetical protein [Legionella erythra]|uniref:Coiled coil domain-containing protein n=1 Tax=Legionella erythra TaxID=448 RepID=A0A0W0TVZ2_LEGER|nr:hypothetical protein [Legionella erythra]KTC99921.1 coiled coil domain-containing protein [Legionella erythra]